MVEHGDGYSSMVEYGDGHSSMVEYGDGYSSAGPDFFYVLASAYCRVCVCVCVCTHLTLLLRKHWQICMVQR